MSDVPGIREDAHSNGAKSAEELLCVVYDELRKLATAKLSHEVPGHTLQPTALVHEAWLRLGGDAQPPWANRSHFFSAAAEAMRRILIDRARSKNRVRHGGRLTRLDLEGVNLAIEDGDDTLLAVNNALDQLAARDALKAQIVKLRYFVGMNHQEIADALGIAEPTVRRHWTFARSWLYAALKTEL